MRKTDSSLPSFLVFLGILGIILFAVALGLYFFRFGTNSLSENHAAWGVFGDYIGGTVGPLIALLAFLGLLWTIRINERELELTREELRHSRVALEQSNYIAEGRAERERAEERKNDLSRVIHSISSDLNALLARPLTVPPSLALSNGQTVRFSDNYKVADLVDSYEIHEHRFNITPKNHQVIRELSIGISRLVHYLRAYEQTAENDFFTAYYKRKYAKYIQILSDESFLKSQADIDYFRGGGTHTPP